MSLPGRVPYTEPGRRQDHSGLGSLLRKRLGSTRSLSVMLRPVMSGRVLPSWFVNVVSELLKRRLWVPAPTHNNHGALPASNTDVQPPAGCMTRYDIIFAWGTTPEMLLVMVVVGASMVALFTAFPVAVLAVWEP